MSRRRGMLFHLFHHREKSKSHHVLTQKEWVLELGRRQGSLIYLTQVGSQIAYSFPTLSIVDFYRRSVVREAWTSRGGLFPYWSEKPRHSWHARDSPTPYATSEQTWSTKSIWYQQSKSCTAFLLNHSHYIVDVEHAVIIKTLPTALTLNYWASNAIVDSHPRYQRNVCRCWILHHLLRRIRDPERTWKNYRVVSRYKSWLVRTFRHNTLRWGKRITRVDGKLSIFHTFLDVVW